MRFVTDLTPNPMRRMRHLIEALPEVGWLLLAFLPPLWVNLWGLQPFELAKVTLVRSVVWLLAAYFISEIVLGRRSLRHELEANRLLLPVSLLAVVLAVTTVTAVNRPMSLWGSYERAQGAVTHLSYLLLFLLAAAHFRSPGRALRLVTAMVAACVPLILLGILQALGWNPLGLVSDARSPVFATLGRANFLGAYLAMMIPLTLALWLTSPQRGHRTAWFVLLLSELIVIGLTLARGAWLATAVSLSLFAMSWWGPHLARRWRKAAWGGVGLLLASGPLLVAWLGSLQGGSSAARLAIWQGTLELIGRRPLLGYGVDALGLVFPGVYPPQLVYYQGRQFFVDRAHNLLLEWTVSAGIPGLLAISLVLIAFVIATGRAVRGTSQPKKRALLLAVLAAILGNTAHNLVSFDVTATATATWMLMGVGLGLAGAPSVQTVAAVPKRSLRQWAVISLLLLCAVTAIWQMNGRPLMADVAARSARRHAQNGDWARAIAAGEEAVAHWPTEVAHHRALSGLYWQQAVVDPSVAQVRLVQAERALRNAHQQRPGDPALWLHSARFYAASTGRFGTHAGHLADEAFRQAAALAPQQATIYAAWGRAKMEQEDAQAAAVLLRRAVSLDASHGQAYVDLGAAELALGRVEIALADFREAARLLPESGPAYAGLAQCYWQLGRPQEARSAVEKALQHDPQNALALKLRQEISGTP